MPKVGMEPVRRKALVDAALKTIGHHGSLTVTMSEIAREAGVSPAGPDGAAVLSVDGGPPLAWRTGAEVAPGIYPEVEFQCTASTQGSTPSGR